MSNENFDNVNEINQTSNRSCINPSLCLKFINKWKSIIKERGIEFGMPQIAYHGTFPEKHRSIVSNGFQSKYIFFQQSA